MVKMAKSGKSGDECGQRVVKVAKNCKSGKNW